ncbi:MAG: hypothetical protein SGI74_09700 [Oligoflexia bacterium]|nr:hypothetical protein [Oligoflexia bacterium]
MKLLWLFSIIAIVMSCSTTSKNNTPVYESVPTPPGFVDSTINQLTSDGDNFYASFSTDGSRIIYLSKNKSAHKNTQIYIMNLKNPRHRRITYNDGEDTSPRFSHDGKKIIYSSTTDEQKEKNKSVHQPKSITPNEQMAKLYEWKFLNNEIYQSDADGSHIVRLTRHTGYDAEGIITPDGKKIFYTSLSGEDLEIHSIDAQGRAQKQITSLKGYNGQTQYLSATKQLVWSGTRSEESAQIHVADNAAKKIKQLTTKVAIHWFPSWSPDGNKIIFSSNRDDNKNFELYLMNADGTCLKRLTYVGGTDLMPSFSPDGKKILFTSDRTGTSQIYLMDLQEPQECSAEVL